MAYSFPFLYMRIIITIAFCLFTMKTFCQLDNGVYQGLERMTGYDRPRKWYHLNTAYVRNDTMFLYKRPIVIHRKDTVYSASDGGFYYYFGRINKLDTPLSVQLSKNNCDYCAVRFKMDTSTGFSYPIIDTVEYIIRKTSNGFSFNGVQYTLKRKKLEPFWEERFYPDKNAVYRINPKEQYKLISQSIETFLASDSLKINDDTIYICSSRYEINLVTGKDSILEPLDPSRLNVHYQDKQISFIDYVALKARMEKESKPFRFVQIGEIIDYKKAARINLTYRILVPDFIKGFSERQYQTLLEYNKSDDDYILREKPFIGFMLIEK
jgi:hypothetical protein